MSPSRRRRRASPEWEGRDIITVAALPGRGLYVRHLGHPEGVDGVHRPTVPPPGAPHRPPAVFDPHWLAENLDAFDVVHVHGLPPRITPGEVDGAARLVRDAGHPLVVTTYHLSDPSGTDDGHFAAQLDALMPHADAVVTLTESAAGEVRSRWDIEPLLVPHPHAVDFVRMRRERNGPRPGSVLVGTHLGSLRMPVDPVEFVGALSTAAAAVPEARLVVHLHDHLLDPDSSRYAPGTLQGIQRAVEQAGGVLRAHRPMTDPQLWDHLFSLDLSVLPPILGSHSIWPEACYDLGTRVAAPAGSLAADQRPSLGYDIGSDGSVDAAGLKQALETTRAQESLCRADPAERWKERVGIAETLRALYERLLSAAA